MLVFAIIVTSIGLVLLRAALRKLGRHRRRLRLLRTAAPLSASCKIGELVKFGGRLGYPELNTPISGKPVGYFRSVLRAVFQAKAKRPAKGMTTHRPVLALQSSDGEPLLLTASDGELVHLCFSKPWEQYEDLSTDTRSLASIPPQFTSLKQAKHRGYQVSESWYEVRAELFGLGILVGRNRAGVVVGAIEDDDDRQLLSSRTEAELRAAARASSNWAWLSMLAIVASLVTVWGLYAR